jgi:hypothetical protein
VLAAALVASVSLPAAGADSGTVAVAAKKKCKKGLKRTAGKKGKCKKRKKQPPRVSGLAINPVYLEFGAVGVGQTSAPKTFTVTNTGNYSSGHLAFAFGGPDLSSFSVSRDLCTGAQLPAGGSCAIDFRFAPLTPGKKSGTVSVVGTQGGTDLSLYRGTGAL